MQYIAVDLETDGLEARYDSAKEVWYGHLYGSGHDEGYRSIYDMYESMSEISKESETTWIFHNAAFDVAVFRVNGFDIRNYTDTMGIAYCLEPDSRKSLNELAWSYLQERKYIKPSFDKYTDELAEYCRQDTILTYNLFNILIKELAQDSEALHFYYEIELPYIDIIIEMQTNGVYVDTEELKQESVRVEKLTKDLRRQMRQIVRRNPNKRSFKLIEGFNPNSGDQIASALINVYGWKPTEFTDSGKPKVDKNVLKTLDYPLAKLLVEYSKWAKYQESFLIPLKTRQVDSIVYGNFNQFKVRTGRLSSSKPNLQNIPSRDDRGATIRKMFIAPQGYDCVVGDLDRIELVVLAFYLEYCIGYSALADQIRNGIDVHSENAKRWHSVLESVEDFRNKHRKPCKNGVFALIYGAGVTKFAQTISVNVDRAKDLIASDELLVAVDKLRKIIIKEAMNNDGIVHNFFGRRLSVPELLDYDNGIVSSGKRKIFNYIIQGTAGDIFKYLQLKAQDTIYEEMLFAKQIIVVHDEALYYIDSNWSSRGAEVLTECYSDKDLLQLDGVSLPISCEFNVGKNWYEAKGD